jgi:ribonucleoside-diphosphate reductase alpha chain
VVENRPFDLVNPRTGRSVKRIGAHSLFDLIVNAAWRTGDPGLIFLDHVNRANPTPELGGIEATNPCGEVPLLPYESCILASINLDRMTTDDAGDRIGRAAVDWDRLRDRIRWGVRFLDDVIDVNRYPLESIRVATTGNRKIGLGVMGFADLLIRLGIPYGSRESVTFAGRLMRFVRQESLAASRELAQERGVFPNFARSVHAKAGRELRNATVNTIAPTGTISFIRNVLSGSRLFESHPLFERLARDRGFHSRELLAEVARRPTLAEIKGVPNDVKSLFLTAFDVAPRQHLEIQAAFQKHTDNAVSKTINLPADSTVEDVREIYLQAHRLKCKGITVYRYGSKAGQVLSVNDEVETRHDELPEFISADQDYAGGCASGVCEF